MELRRCGTGVAVGSRTGGYSREFRGQVLDRYRTHFGELVQMDGSFHEWLEERGGRGCLMHMVDDATSTAEGRFFAQGTICAAVVGVLRGCTVTDTVGRAITATPTSISYKDSSGISRTITSSAAAYPDSNTLSLEATSCQLVDASPGTGVSYIPSTISNNYGSGHIVNTVTIPAGSGSLTYSVSTDNLGEPIKIDYPTGGYTKYDYTTLLSNTYDAGGVRCALMDNRQIAQKRVCANSSAASSGSCEVPESITTYSPVISENELSNSQMTIVGPVNDSGLQAKTVYSYSAEETATGGTPVAPQEVERTIFSRNATSGNDTLLRTVTTTYWRSCGANASSSGDGNGGVGYVPDVVTTAYNDVSPEKTTTTTYNYDPITVYNVGSGNYPQSGASDQVGSGECTSNPTSVSVTGGSMEAL